MKPRNIIPYYEGVTLPPSHARHVLQRNSRLAESLAKSQGFTVQQPDSGHPAYHFLPTPITQKQAEQAEIQSRSDFYGAIVEHMPHADKAQLHETIPHPDYTPHHYSLQFARAVREAVLPGYTAFTKEDTIKAYHLLKKELDQHDHIRLKDPTSSDCERQFLITNEDQLRAVLEKNFHPFPTATGVVIELNLQSTTTTTGGKVIVGKQEYQFIGNQVETTTMDERGNTRNVYGGGNITVVKGPLNPYEYSFEEQDLAKRMSTTFHAYDELIPLHTRLSFDMVTGHTARGEKVSGITDPTLRVGGNDPGIIEAMHSLTSPSVKKARVETRVVYTSTEPELPFNGTLYLDMDDIKIVTRVREQVRHAIQPTARTIVRAVN